MPDTPIDRSALEALRADFRAQLASVSSDGDLKALHDRFLGRKSGSVTALMKTLGTLPAEERKDYIIQNGFGIPENIKQAFLDGYVEVGMAREMVFQLYGSPDRTTGQDTNWEYVNNKGNLITGITFKADKVEKLYGDPRGGSGEPHAAI